MTPGERPARSFGVARLGDLLGTLRTAWRAFARPASPLLDLATRAWLAQGFLVSGLLKLSDWNTALNLARNEYPVPWLDPLLAARLGVGVELAGGALLLAGLATRGAALATLLLAWVIQVEYRALDVHLLWIALLLRLVTAGAGPLSLDAAFARGLARSAVPLADFWLASGDLLRRKVWPVAQAALRVAVAMAVSAGAGDLHGLLPLESAARFWHGPSDALPFAFAAGLGTRVVAAAWLLQVVMLQMHGAWVAQDVCWALLLGAFVVGGGGTLSLDRALHRVLARTWPELEGRPAFSLSGLPRVVIVGAGFGGLACARALARTPVQVTLVDRHNYHLFQPLLYQVATTALSPADIASPVRSLLRDQFNLTVLLGEATGVDRSRGEVRLGARTLAYDYLVLATGAGHSYFGRDEWAPFAPGLKQVEDAVDVRRRVLVAFEHAEAAPDEAERTRLLTFLIVGAGPTGVELAGALAELARFGLAGEYRAIDPGRARIVLVQAGPRILPTFPEPLSAHAHDRLKRLGVEVLCDSRVEQIDAEGVLIDGRRIPAGTVLWAAGVVASPAGAWLGCPTDRAGRVQVGPDLAVPGMDRVFALGDTALALAWKGSPVPGLAPAAKQGGAYVARVIRARVHGRPAPPAFRYRHLGSLATIGRSAAVADFGLLRLSGAPAWWLWGAIHVGFLAGLRNRISVLLDWGWSYLTLRGGSRLITDAGVRPGSATPLAAAGADTATPQSTPAATGTVVT